VALFLLANVGGLVHQQAHPCVAVGHKVTMLKEDVMPAGKRLRAEAAAQAVGGIIRMDLYLCERSLYSILHLRAQRGRQRASVAAPRAQQCGYLLI
jgi:hypothetical protein